MPDMSKIKEHMEIIGADGVHVGTVDRVENNRIKLIKSDSGEGRHKGHHHYIDSSLIAEVEGTQVRLSANAEVAVATVAAIQGADTAAKTSATTNRPVIKTLEREWSRLHRSR